MLSICIRLFGFRYFGSTWFSRIPSRLTKKMVQQRNVIMVIAIKVKVIFKKAIQTGPAI